MAILALIIILSFALRVWKLDSALGDAFNQDEAMRGYDAYSLVETGKDHRGNAWPMYFEGFSDKRDNYTPLYTYTLMPFVKVLGLSEFSVRLPAAIMGTLTVLIVYFLALEIFRNRKIALVSAFALAVSSWHIFLSRLGMEVIILPFLISLALLFFLKWIHAQKSIFLMLSSAVWAISLYSYSTARLFVPLMLAGLLYFYRKQIWQNRKAFMFALLIMAILAAPLVAYNISHWETIQGRFQEISILYNPHESGYNEFSFFRTHDQFWIIEFIKNYIDSAVLIYLIPLFSLSYELVFVIIGIFYLLKISNPGPQRNLLIFWLLIFPIPSAITSTNPHILRTTTALPLMQILVALGLFYSLKLLYQFLRQLKTAVAAKVLVIFLAFLLLFTSIFFNLSYLQKTNFNPPNFIEFDQYGFRKITTFLKENKDKYDNIIFTEKANQPYIFVLFYLSWPPNDLQNRPPTRGYSENGWQQVTAFDKFKFCNLSRCFQNQPKTLIISRGKELTDLNLPVIDKWENPNGTDWKISSVK